MSARVGIPDQCPRAHQHRCCRTIRLRSPSKRQDRAFSYHRRVFHPRSRRPRCEAQEISRAQNAATSSRVTGGLFVLRDFAVQHYTCNPLDSASRSSVPGAQARDFEAEERGRVGSRPQGGGGREVAATVTSRIMMSTRLRVRGRPSAILSRLPPTNVSVDTRCKH